MNDEPALLAAIEADPADDTVLLAYADWLDENDGAWCPKPQCRVTPPQHEGFPQCSLCRGSGRVHEHIKEERK